MKNTLIFVLLGLFSYFFIVYFTDFSASVADVLYSRGALIYTVVAFVLLGFATLHISEWLCRRYVQESGKRWQQTLVNIVVAALFFMINYSVCVIAKMLADVQPVYSLSNTAWQILGVVWVAEIVIILLLISNHAQTVNQGLRQEAARLQIENSRARYEALQSQLNPHFLFNSLNTLIAEIQYNPDNAVKFTRHLSNVYRYVLQCQNRSLVTVGEEIAFVRSFVFLHQVRIGACLNCDIQIPDEMMDAEIPPLTLQLLVENVVKHNSISMTKPMVICITASGDAITVKNLLSPKKTTNDASLGIGLKNLSKRCLMMCNRDIEVNRDNATFSVTIPIIK